MIDIASILQKLDSDPEEIFRNESSGDLNNNPITFFGNLLIKYRLSIMLDSMNLNSSSRDLKEIYYYNQGRYAAAKEIVEILNSYTNQ